MKTIKRILFFILLFAAGNITDAASQNWLERLGKRAEESDVIELKSEKYHTTYRVNMRF